MSTTMTTQRYCGRQVSAYRFFTEPTDNRVTAEEVVRVRVLIAEDEQLLADTIADGLRRLSMAVDVCYDGQSALDLVSTHRYDVAVLDRDMPIRSGDDVCREIAASDDNVRVLMLTAASGIRDRVDGLSIGADDYLTKPFSPKTMLARVKALLRRASADRPAAPLMAGRVTLDLEGYSVRIGGGDAISLTKLELRLLQMLLAQAGRAVNSDRLLVQVWGHRGSGDRQLLKQLVHRLRHKIEANPAVPQLLQTAAPSGYKLVVE
jgi:DNA-binding response OmpR family regulator